MVFQIGGSFGWWSVVSGAWSVVGVTWVGRLWSMAGGFVLRCKITKCYLSKSKNKTFQENAYDLNTPLCNRPPGINLIRG